MKRENKFDVRVSYHTASKTKKFVFFRFYNEMEQLITDGLETYVKFVISDDRLYFFPYKQKEVDCLKMTWQVNASRHADELKAFVGMYNLDYDSDKHAYYIDKTKASPILDRRYGAGSGPRLNYKAHKNEPYVSESDNVELNATYVQLFDKAKEELQINKRQESVLTLKAIIALIEVGF